MSFMNYDERSKFSFRNFEPTANFNRFDEFIIPTDAHILNLVLHSPELLEDNVYIKKRYSQIIIILNKLTITNDNININNMRKSKPIFSASRDAILST